MKDIKFIKGVERLINPMDVGTMHFFQTFNRLVPKPIIRRLLLAASKKSPFMGFVVEPYSLFLCYELTDLKKAQDLIPERFKLIKTRIFKNDAPKYYAIIAVFNTHTSGFWGTRQESYVIAEDTQTGLLTWVIIDINSNTISAEPNRGVVDPNVKNALMTTNAKGTLFVDIKHAKSGRHLALTCQTKKAPTKQLDQRLWLEGNLSIAYGKKYADDEGQPFSVTFDPIEVEEALDIPFKNLSLSKQSLFKGLFKKTPAKIVCFPYAQHFISDSPGNYTPLKNKTNLINHYTKLGDLKGFNAFSAKNIRRQFFLGFGMSILISYGLLIFLILHFIYKH